MLFRHDTLHAIRQGAVTLAFRRWRQARVRSGSRIRTPVGIVEVGEVTAVAPHRVSDQDARRAGYASAAELRAAQAGPEDHPLFRIELAYGGPDPREALREQAELSEAELDTVTGRLARLDRASRHGAWTGTVLGVLREHPARRAAELAELAGYHDPAMFKRDVRKLKELGLTESLGTGYRLSPRGARVLGRWSGHQSGGDDDDGFR